MMLCMLDLIVALIAHLQDNPFSEVDIIIPILQMRKTDAQRGGVTCSRPHSKHMPESGFKFRFV